MSGDGGFDKRVQASVTSEMKTRLRELVDNQVYESEAEIIRLALGQFTEDGAAVTNPVATTTEAETIPALTEDNTHDLHQDLKERMDLLAWLMTVGLMLMATIASRILETLTHEKVVPMHLLEQAVGSSIHEQDGTRRKLAAGWHAFKQAGLRGHNGKTAEKNGAAPQQS